MEKIQPYLDILQREPAPSPYNRIVSNDKFEIEGSPLQWKTYYLDAEKPLDDSRIMLVDADNTPWLILNYGCYIKLINDSKVLIRYCSSKPETREYFIAYFDLADLQPIDMAKAHKVLTDDIKDNPKNNPLSTVFYGYYAEFKNTPITFTIPNKLSQGTNSYTFPKGFDIKEEIIVTGYYAVDSHDYEWEYNPWINPFCILLLRPEIQEIEVICVDWFNTETWDMDYQWITRVARDPKTQKFIGEGMRIGIFQLDETGKKLEKWIFREDFYMYPSSNS